jgi:hypothetical protein
MTGEPAAGNGPEAAAYPPPGTAVQVRSRFDGGWCKGFQVAEVVATDIGVAIRVRRLSDGAELPALFSVDDVFAPRLEGGP